MKLSDPIAGIIIQVDAISPEVERAQRMAELKNIAEYRKRRMAAYIAWSKPEAIAQRKAEHEAQAAAALDTGRAMAAMAKEQIDSRKDDRPLSLLKISILERTATKPIPWYRRLLAWLRR